MFYSVSLSMRRFFRQVLVSGLLVFSGSVFAQVTGADVEEEDITAPTLLNLDPVDDAIDVNLDVQLRLVFSEAIARDRRANNFELRRKDNDAEVFDLGSNVQVQTTNVTNDTLLINLPTELEDLTEYYLFVSATAVEDVSSNQNKFAGLLTPEDYNFTTGDFQPPAVIGYTPQIDASTVGLSQNLELEFDEPVQTGGGAIALYQGTPQVLFHDPLNDASLLNVTQGYFFADNNVSFNPDPILGVNDGAGGGDFGGDTPADRTVYNGFDGGFMEANGFSFGSVNPTVIEWQNIDVTGAERLHFSADFASALRPDTNDSVIIEAIVDGGTPVRVLAFTSSTLDGVFEAEDTGRRLTDTAQRFARTIPGTGTSLTIRATLSLSGTDDSGDDIAIDNVRVFGDGVGTSTQVEQVAATSDTTTMVGNTMRFDPDTYLDPSQSYYVVVEPGAVTDTQPALNAFIGIVAGDWRFTTGAFTPPSVSALSPAQGETDVSLSPSFSITFDRAMQLGTSSIELRRASDDALVESFDVTMPKQVSLGTNSITNDTVFFASGLLHDTNTDYYVLVPPGALLDGASTGNEFRGISDTSTWRFTTTSAAAELSLSGDSSLLESDTSQLTVTRSVVNVAPLEITISNSLSTALTTPLTVTIPANSASVMFQVAGVNDDVINASRVASVGVSAAGYAQKTIELEIIDEDDDDSDTIADLVDNCPIIANTDQADLDRDGFGDACDADDDNDTFADDVDNCPLIANSDQADLDRDGLGDACDTDDDDDTVADVVDNCPMVTNIDQADLDRDGFGDVCDTDIDGDTVTNNVDNCPLIANSDQADFESDGVGDVCDSDDDGDGLPDAYELANGLDPRNSFDRDADPDRDGFTNLREYELGSNPQMADTDDNANGIPDAVENQVPDLTPILQLLLLDDDARR